MSNDLAAILAADFVGYDGLTADARDSAAMPLSDFEGFFARHVDRHHGRVMNIGAEAHYLTKFSNASEAVGCAVDVQRHFAERRGTLPKSRQLGFRIGVKHEGSANKGEVSIDDDSDSVMRLVAFSEPGGICISRTVYDEVRFQFDLHYDTTTDPKQTSLLCQELRLKWNELNLLELSAVKISATALRRRPGKLATVRYAINEAKGLMRKIRALLDRSVRE